MNKHTEHLAADLELWADRIEDRRRFITPDEMNCAAIMRLAAQIITERKPLTFEQTYELWLARFDTSEYDDVFMNFARAIEKAHGIV